VYFRWTVLILAVAFPLFVGMVVLDFAHAWGAVEDAFKIVAGTLILVGFLAAWLDTTTPGGRR
jgi:ABC-type uncharacterized transport system permease subunit